MSAETSRREHDVRPIAAWCGRALALALLAAATQAHAGYLWPYRPWDALAFVALWTLVAIGLWRHRDPLLAVLLIAAASVFGVREGGFWRAWLAVRMAPRPDVERLAAHLVVGFRDWREAERLALDLGVGGLFLTAHNVRSLTREEVAERIHALQSARGHLRRPPLLIMADQEGGPVSRLSPPLSAQPPLGGIVRDAPDLTQLRERVRSYAAEQAEQLQTLGVTVNLAPVLDLSGNVSRSTPYTRLDLRALSSDAHIAAEAGVTYCQELEQHGLRCTAKHFPGLGRVVEDTHLRDAELDTSVAELAASDWIPFRAVLERTGALLMVGHARLSRVDSVHPASFSPDVLAIVRRSWGFDGVVISDDVSMAAARDSDIGLGAGSARALAAGVDLLLISYDGDLVWPVLDGLLRATASSALTNVILVDSERRLAALRRPASGPTE